MKNVMKKLITGIIVSFYFCTVIPVIADKPLEEAHTTYFDISIFSPVEIFFKRPRLIKGVNIICLYSSARETYGVPIGSGVHYTRNEYRGASFNLAQITGGTGKGFQVTGLNYSGLNFSGFQTGVLGNLTLTNFVGFQVSGLLNYTGKNFNGLQSGAINYSGRNAEGVQVGIYNITKRNFDGLQVALANMVKKDMQGLQIGILNYTRKKVKAFQFGIVSIITKDFKGFQCSGINFIKRWAEGLHIGGINIIGKNMLGVQVGGVNFVKWKTKGMQMGVVNIANKIKGTQIGLINVSKKMRGIPVGLINIILDGKLDISVYASLKTLMNVGVRSRSKYSYGILTLGSDTREDDNVDKAYIGAGSGVHIPFDPFYVELETTYNTAHNKFSGDLFKKDPERYSILKFRSMLGWNVFKSMSLFLGPSGYIYIYPDESLKKTALGADFSSGLNYTFF